MEDFFRHKIVWKRIGSILRFSFDRSGSLALDSTCFAVGNHIKYLVAILNSKFGKYLMKESPKTGTGDLLISVQAIEPLLIPIPNSQDLKNIEDLMDMILNDNSISIENCEFQINQIIYSQIGLTKDEIDFIESQ
ncbi:hypothetical protein CMT48_03530 [Elizabethkingia anophelis]|uniref:Uncharacterized protein n=2 Tax=Elizabethkingia anophelis TaxID=1117645 RepID=A0A494J7K4_9FLAO|nr:hypothetical protein [Elizabethkingia anophelis]AMR43103.1 hypothetical protein A2T74_17825 [Elizabethkingia anophelis]AQX50808.1 hypothetical protein AYC66_09005 [Elizabethkingia anophelis]EJG2064024.1 hypothetical protein [Elizabethkingia anophelis]EJG2067825.1 hypothetical protein [Elizabethkingia anophelis]EJG2071750.1 hypothetical protein [Elizabethkingia anophelis]